MSMASNSTGCTVMHVAPTYPNGLDQLVIKSVTGQEVLLGAQPN